MRFHRPIGILVLLWPTLTGLWLASHGHPGLKLVLIFTAGTIIMRAAGCIINDIADRHVDRHVARTKDRPLTSKRISTKSALVLFCCLCAVALVLLLQLNALTWIIAVIALGLATLYPFTKRWIPIPQLFLGLAFACSIPMAFVAVQHSFSGIDWIFTLFCILWPIAYDTEYAMVDREDDLKIGIKSSAIFFGRFDVLAIGILQLMCLLLLERIGVYYNFGYLYSSGLCIVAILFIYQQWLIKNKQPKDCFRAFLNNNWVGIVVFLMVLFSFR